MSLDWQQLLAAWRLDGCTRKKKMKMKTGMEERGGASKLLDPLDPPPRAPYCVNGPVPALMPACQELALG